MSLYQSLQTLLTKTVIVLPRTLALLGYCCFHQLVLVCEAKLINQPFRWLKYILLVHISSLLSSCASRFGLLKMIAKQTST